MGTIVWTNEKQQPYKEIVVFMIFDLKHPIPYRIWALPEASINTE